MGAGDVIAALHVDFPEVAVRFVRESGSAGPYTLVVIEGIPPEHAVQCCDEAWSHSRVNILGKYAVVAQDTTGNYWGLDASHFVEPKATYELKGRSKGFWENRKDPLMAVLLESGQAFVHDENIYVIHPASAWGPLPERLPVAFGAR